MKKRLFSEKRKKEETEEYYQRQKQKWECIRRNKDYIQDFRKYRKRELNEDERALMFEKWDVWEKLPDPTKSIPDAVEEYVHYPYPHYPYMKMDFFAGPGGGHKVSGWIFPPGKAVKERVRLGKSRVLEDWAMFDIKSGRYEKLTTENCPRSISILIEIQPWFTKAMIEEKLMGKFETAFQKVRDAQRAILKRPRRPHLDESDFRRILTVYDLKTKDPPLSIADIALKLFPEETSPSVAYKRKPKRDKSPQSSAKDKVKYYWREAQRLINKGGWRYL